MATVEQANAIGFHPLEQEEWVAYALTRIRLDYGHICIANRLDVNKFGANANVGTTEVSINSWGADEDYQTSDIVLNLASSSILDAGKTIDIAYVFINGGEYQFGVMQNVALNAIDGRTVVALPNAAIRWTRMLSTSETMIGNVSLFRGAAVAGVPSTLGNIHQQIPAGGRVSENVATTITSRSYGILLNFWGGVIEKQPSAATIRLKARLPGEDFVTLIKKGSSSNSALNHDFKSPIVIPEQADILMTAKANGPGTDITGGYAMVIADIVGIVKGFVPPPGRVFPPE